jgi:drug/metabolite transporter (DMT)-like permease
MSKNERKHRQGYWMGIGMSIGIALGVAFGPAFDNFGVGIGIGVAIGAGIGSTLEQRHKDDLRPLTEQEKVRQKRSLTIGLALAGIMLIALVIAYLFVGR